MSAPLHPACLRIQIALLLASLCLPVPAIAEDARDPNSTSTLLHDPASATALFEPGAPVKSADSCPTQVIQPNSMTPTWDTPASTTQCGALETDNLAIAQSVDGGFAQHMLVSTSRYGVTSRLEIRWGLPGHIRQSGPGAPAVAGTTDQWLGVCYRFHNQGPRLPDFAFDYALKLPTANPAKGLGTGYADHQFTFIASRDLGRSHLDFNAVGSVTGSPSGRDAEPAFGMALTRTLSPRLLATIEVYGGPQPNADAYAAVLLGGSVALRPWLALNGAYTRAFTAGSPHRQIMVGFIFTTLIRPLPHIPAAFKIPHPDR